MIGYEWRPIEDLPDDWRETLASSELAGLFGVWKERVVELKDSPAYQEFMARLCREWAIETGIIEGLYDIDRGVTRTLIEHGLNASLIAHGDANKPASQIIPMLKDHEMVVEGLFDFVGQQRQLSTSYIKQVHQALTTHQETAEGRDQRGHITEIPLRRGDWKKWPNNPTRPDGKVHEYCPPEQVASEMDCLIAMHEQHMRDDVPPEVEAAWLHHRFTQIHPFQDGNGRVARALASLVFIRAGWFPFVVNRDDRANYIDSLEKADAGNLKLFTTLLGRMQKRAFDQAMQLSDSVLLASDSIEQIIVSGAKAIKERQEVERLKQEEAQRIRLQFIQISEDLKLIVKERLELISASFQNIGLNVGLQEELSVETEELQTASPESWSFNLKLNKVVIGFTLYPARNTGFRIVKGGVYAASYEEDSILIEIENFECASDEPIAPVKLRYKQWLEEALILGLAAWRKRL